ncbi:GNAT family N-acetyltransferase [Streptomyces microflavus]|nr:GNAT family N-acetyltransferase [Streptomyces microflavus]
MTRHGPLDEFCWMDLKTRDPSGTAAFFSAVLDWDFAVDEQDWRKAVTISAGDHRIGGLSDLARPVYPPGLPAHIAYYLAVDDVDRRTAVAAENGAQILVPPFDAGDQGRIATLVDPVGAVVSLGRPQGFAGWPVSPPEGAGAVPHHMVLACEDPERARHFYTGMTTGAPPVRAAFVEATTVTAPQWELALAVDDLGRVAARARAHGGELVTVAEGLGRLSSPEGLSFRLHVPETSPVFLETDRLALRPFTDADAPALLALDNDPEVMRYINGGRPTTAESIRERTLPQLLHDHPCTGTRGFWAAEEKATGTFLGWFELRPLTDDDPAVVELGYRLNRAAWGHGYATEGARALVRKGFTDLGAERVTANTMAVNAGSRRVMEKAGLTFLRAYTEDWPDAIEGSEDGEVEYVLTRAEWEKRRA